MELESVTGVGPKKAKALNALGVHSVQDLAQLDLRTVRGDVPGWTREGLAKAKANARQQLKKAGVTFEKAPYHAEKKRSWWSRIRGR